MPGAVLANRVTSESTAHLGPLPSGTGTAAVPDLATLPEPVAQTGAERLAEESAASLP